MTIVHTQGIFSHEVSVCNCPGSNSNDWHLDLLRQRLFPASISKPKTAFTFDVLDHFLIDALECKASAMSLYQKLKRFTNNASPERVQVEFLPGLKNSIAMAKHFAKVQI
ncbi:hypothetical protein EDC04DRAFT_2571716 [Pisolithus marmoratus]|nr:hypothetical protein EDC04DRAFT_2571716 [Pisolithus marmoratus]